MTASDFHKILRKLYDEQPGSTLHMRVAELSLKLPVEQSVLLEHLSTLETLDLIQFYDEKKEVFFLTESGKLANLP